MAGRIAYYGNIVTQGLVLDLDAAIQGSYPKTGSTWFDISNNGNNGTLISSSLYDPTVFGNVTFNGTASYVQFPLNNFPSGNADLSFNSWIKWNGDGVNNGDFIIGYGNDTAANKVPLILIDPNKKARFEFGSSAGVVTSSFDIPTGSWTSITATYNRSFNTLYVNGSPVGNRAYNAAGIEPNGFNGFNGALGALFSTFGNVGTGTTRRYGTFNGNIAVAQVYNIPLSQFQVWQNFNAYKSRYGIPDIVTDGLVLNLDAGNPYSYLSGSSGTTWTDVSGQGNNGTLTNGPVYNNGNITFDGINDYVVTTTGLTPSLNITSQITLETWLMSTATASAQHGAGINSKGLSSDNNSGVYETTIVNSGGINYPFFRMRIGSNTPIYNPTNIPINLNQIYHFVSTYNGSIMRIFINGIESGTGSAQTGNIETNTQTLVIGCRYTHAIVQGNFVSDFPGRIYNNKIYNRALTPTEIQQNFNALRGRYGI